MAAYCVHLLGEPIPKTHWILDGVPPAGRTLLLCRANPTVEWVRRALAVEGGRLELDIATPSGLVAQAYQPPLLAGAAAPRELEADLPTGSALHELVAGRPGLVGAARRWSQRAMLAVDAGCAPTLPTWLGELCALRWGETDDTVATRWLLEQAHAHGRELSVSFRWDHVISVGFEGPGRNEPWHEVLLQRLGAIPLQAPAEREQALKASSVPTVSDEARLAVEHALQDPAGTLILATSEATARRIASTIRRNGSECSWQSSTPVRVHSAASVALAASRWFAQATEDPRIEVRELSVVLHGIGPGLHPVADQWLTERLEGMEGRPPPLRSHATTPVIRATRLLEAPLSLWLARLEGICDSASHRDLHRRAAAGILARLKVLQAALAQSSLHDHLAPTGIPELDDFEAALAELLDEAERPTAPPPFSIGCLRQFLVDCRLQVQGDAAARAVLSALGKRSQWSASLGAVQQAMAGSVDPERLSGGIELLLIDDYDGRPCRQLVAVDLHDKGITRTPPPDPLLHEAGQLELGVAAGRHLAAQRLALLAQATRRAERAVAVISEADANGRAVVPPIQLPLAPGIAEPRHPLPESARAAQLAIKPAGASQHPPGGTWGHLAIQASLEWVRAGRGVLPARSKWQHGRLHPTLTMSLKQARPIASPHLLRWLGHAEGVDEARLPQEELSASGAVGPAARCLYQAFARRVLQLREVKEVDEDFDPAELGVLAHAVLQRAAGTLYDSPNEVVEALHKATKDVFAEALADMEGLSEVRKQSAVHHSARWKRHWSLWASSRQQGLRPADAWKLLEVHPAFHHAIEVLQRMVPAARTAEITTRIKRWLVLVAMRDEQRLVARPEEAIHVGNDWGSMPASWIPDLPGFFVHPSFRRLRAAVQRAHRVVALPEGRRLWGEAELPFGSQSTTHGSAMGPISIDLGRPTHVRGEIDRVDAFAGEEGVPAALITDYKSNASGRRYQHGPAMASLAKPQLLLYALALQASGLASPAVIALDHLKATHDEEGSGIDTWWMVDEHVLDWARDELGALLEDAREGRWTLRPLAHSCPHLKAYGAPSCPAARGCRLRALPEDP